jgi:NAD(P)-dependent dehydrogenase (short-subunit alcohol dehydrogenase family)
MTTDDATAVVVGAGPGLGLAVARRFAREGFRLALLARSPERLDRTGMDALPVSVDLADEEALRAAFAQVRSSLGDPRVLVFNASEYVEGTPSEVPYDAFLHGFRVGVAAALVCLQEVAPAMRAAGRGTVLITGGGLGLRPWPPAAGLGVQKAAVRNLALAAAKELGPDGVHVATVTIQGVIRPGSGTDPQVLAEQYWQLHAEAPQEAWRTEVVVDEQAEG